MSPRRANHDESDVTANPAHGPVTGEGSGAEGGGEGAQDGAGQGRVFGAEDAQIMQILASIPQHAPQADKDGEDESHDHPDYAKNYRPNVNVPVSDSPRGGSTARSPRSSANVFLRSPPPGLGGPSDNSISTGYQSPGTLALASSASAWPSIPAGSPTATTTPRRGAARATRGPTSQSPEMGHDPTLGQQSPEGDDEGVDETYSGDEGEDSPLPKGKPRGGARKGQPKPRLDKSTDAWRQTRKDNHKEVERRRRETINDGITELKKIVPGTEKNKGEILKQAVKYIQHLKEAEASNIEKWTLEKLLTDQALHEQGDRVRALEREVAELRDYVRRLGGREDEVPPYAAAVGSGAAEEGGGGGGQGGGEGHQGMQVAPAEANGIAIDTSLGKRTREETGGSDKRVRVS